MTAGGGGERDADPPDAKPGDNLRERNDYSVHDESNFKMLEQRRQIEEKKKMQRNIYVYMTEKTLSIQENPVLKFRWMF